MIESVLYNTAIYCRLSLDDGSIGDSGSITTQRMMLEKYCRDNNFVIKEVYVDDGYSGLNFDRPAFKRLISDIESGKINMVITKDLSRLGRDYLQTGYYTEQYFPLHDVRYIAVNDGVDTLIDNNDIAPFKNILNDMYAKDLSRKVRSAKRQRALNGLFISAQVPYGYAKDPSNKNHLIVDEDVRHVIELIFELCVKGKGTQLIANELEERRILNPSAYKTLNGSTRFSRLKESNPYKWKSETVRKILTDKVYCGHMENGKYRVENYKTKRRVRVPDDEHIIVMNTHEAIITESMFESAKTVLEARHYPARHEHENLFKSIIFCQCGKRMLISHKIRNGKMHSFYKCSNHENNPDECPRSNIVQYGLIKEVIEKELHAIIDCIKDDGKIFKALESRMKKDQGKSDDSEIRKTESRIDKLIKIASKLYEDHSSDLINDRTYKELLSKNRQEQDMLEQRLQALKDSRDISLSKLDKIEQLKEEFVKFLDELTLTSEMVNSLIERIEVGYPEMTESGKKERSLRIIYKFIDDSLL